MKLRLLALAATAATALVASSASAATYTYAAGSVTVGSVTGVHITEPLITDFNSNDNGSLQIASGYSFDQHDPSMAFTRDGGLGLWGGMSAPPPADNNVNGAFYETVLGNGGVATLTSDVGMYNFQFYMGSPDEYNTVRFTFADGSSLPLAGNNIWGGNPPGNGDQSEGFTVSYHFTGEAVKSITFGSGNQNSFEFDKLAGGVPEPASWALMIIGFGGAGAALRGRRRMAGATAA